MRRGGLVNDCEEGSENRKASIIGHFPEIASHGRDSR